MVEEEDMVAKEAKANMIGEGKMERGKRKDIEGKI